jgi:hypothetical protein
VEFGGEKGIVQFDEMGYGIKSKGKNFFEKNGKVLEKRIPPGAALRISVGGRWAKK